MFLDWFYQKSVSVKHVENIMSILMLDPEPKPALGLLVVGPKILAGEGSACGCVDVSTPQSSHGRHSS